MTRSKSIVVEIGGDSFRLVSARRVLAKECYCSDFGKFISEPSIVSAQQKAEELVAVLNANEEAIFAGRRVPLAILIVDGSLGRGPLGAWKNGGSWIIARLDGVYDSKHRYYLFLQPIK